MNILLALLIFSLIVFVHELGHFVAARKAGILVVEFSIGMGPRLLKYQPGETMYSLKLLPLGGSCQMLGADTADDDERAFNSKPVGKRMAVILGGAFMNFVLAFVVAVLIVSFNRFPEASILDFTPVSPIRDAGAMPGDRIVSLNGRSITVYGDFMLEMILADGSPIPVELDRNGVPVHLTITPMHEPQNDRWLMGFIPGRGIGPLASNYEMMPDGNVINLTTLPGVRSLNFGQSLVQGFHDAVFAARSVVFVLVGLFSGQFGLGVLMGPVGIVGAIGDEAAAGMAAGGLAVAFWGMMQFIMLISANLGVLNLLPLPALDGGRMVFLILEAIRRKPLNPEKEGMVHFAGFVMLMVVAVFVAYNDILRLF